MWLTKVQVRILFLERDRIENIIVGFERWQTMLIAPLKWYDPHDDHMIESYSPVNHKRKLLSRIINNLHFKVLDTNKNKIIFNSGKIVLNAIVYKRLKNWKREKIYFAMPLRRRRRYLIQQERGIFGNILNLDWEKTRKYMHYQRGGHLFTSKTKAIAKQSGCQIILWAANKFVNKFLT